MSLHLLEDRELLWLAHLTVSIALILATSQHLLMILGGTMLGLLISILLLVLLLDHLRVNLLHLLAHV